MKTHQTLNIGVTLLTLAVNGLANALPLNGQLTGEISDRFPIRFVPAGYVFAIWGLIYLGLIAFTVYQALPAQREDETLKRISPLYWLTSLANSVWIFLWHYEFFAWTIFVMAALLVSLIALYRQLSRSPRAAEPGFRRFVKLPFSIYLGWISVATIANAAQWLYFLNWNGWGLSDELWAAIMLLVATGLGFAMLWREADRAYALVLVWAFVGIALKQADSALVATSAWVLAAVLALSTIPGILPKRQTAA